MKRARDAGLLDLKIHNLRDYDARPAQDGGRPPVRRRAGNVVEAGADL